MKSDTLQVRIVCTTGLVNGIRGVLSRTGLTAEPTKNGGKNVFLLPFEKGKDEAILKALMHASGAGAEIAIVKDGFTAVRVIGDDDLSYLMEPRHKGRTLMLASIMWSARCDSVRAEGEQIAGGKASPSAYRGYFSKTSAPNAALRGGGLGAIRLA